MGGAASHRAASADALKKELGRVARERQAVRSHLETGPTARRTSKVAPLTKNIQADAEKALTIKANGEEASLC
jgi:hypothetical protein